MKTSLLYRTDGSVSRIAPENGNDFKIDELRIFTSSRMIEIVPISISTYGGDYEFIAVIDEEGKLNGRGCNYKATQICKLSLMSGDFLSGDVILCDGGMVL